MWFTICHWIWSALEERLLRPHEDNDLKHGMEPPAWAEVRKVIAKTACLPLCRKKKNQKPGVSVASVSKWLYHPKKCESTLGFSGSRWIPPPSFSLCPLRTLRYPPMWSGWDRNSNELEPRFGTMCYEINTPAGVESPNNINFLENDPVFWQLLLWMRIARTLECGMSSPHSSVVFYSCIYS